MKTYSTVTVLVPCHQFLFIPIRCSQRWWQAGHSVGQSRSVCCAWHCRSFHHTRVACRAWYNRNATVLVPFLLTGWTQFVKRVNLSTVVSCYLVGRCPPGVYPQTFAVSCLLQSYSRRHSESRRCAIPSVPRRHPARCHACQQDGLHTICIIRLNYWR